MSDVGGTNEPWQDRWNPLTDHWSYWREVWARDPVKMTPRMDELLAGLQSKPYVSTRAMSNAAGTLAKTVTPEIVAQAEFSTEILRAAEMCEFRRVEQSIGCCGPIYKCIGGRRDGEAVDFLRVCAACMKEYVDKQRGGGIRS